MAGKPGEQNRIADPLLFLVPPHAGRDVLHLRVVVVECTRLFQKHSANAIANQGDARGVQRLAFCHFAIVHH